MQTETNEVAGLIFRKPGTGGGNTSFQNPSSWSKIDRTGVMVTGLYEGTTDENPVTGKKDFRFKALAAGTTVDKSGKLVEYGEGTTVVINASGNLGYQIEKYLEIGDAAQIVYEGLQTITSGPRKGKDAHNFSVLVTK